MLRKYANRPFDGQHLNVEIVRAPTIDRACVRRVNPAQFGGNGQCCMPCDSERSVYQAGSFRTAMHGLTWFGACWMCPFRVVSAEVATSARWACTSGMQGKLNVLWNCAG